MEHPVMAKIKAVYENDRDNAVLKDYSQMLYDLAVIAEGGKLDDPGRFSRLVSSVMSQAID
jgi:molecular chaperone HtpG